VDKDIRTDFAIVPLNTPVPVSIALSITASASDPGASAIADFLHSADFVTGTDLFNFTDPGLTANDPDGFVVNNRFVPAAAVPGPSVAAGLPGLLAGCGGLVAWAWRRRQRVRGG